ncbi:MAG: ABC transporter permease [candidate division KSB1 bacterium]|nr:ABC transporter permease [candidate division KSB1 bacterium]MDZ7345319.1 ABC transporter permease [candidate division KSB1 bacterium]
MNGFIYSIKEAWEGFSRARISTVATIFAVFFLIFLLSCLLVLSMNVEHIVRTLSLRQDIQVYINNAASEKNIMDLRARIASKPIVESVQYVSKADAAREFRQVFGDDILSLLEDNPLPASFRIKIKRKYLQEPEIREFIKELQKERGVDEVVYQRSSIEALERFSRWSHRVILAAFFLVLAGSLFMVSNTIRLIIYGRRSIIETMKLVGATHGFIKRPFLIEGMLQGVIGGGIAAALLWAVWKIIEWRWPGFVFVPNEIIIGAPLTGLIFGLIGSWWAVKRYL